MHLLNSKTFSSFSVVLREQIQKYKVVFLEAVNQVSLINSADEIYHPELYSYNHWLDEI